MFHEVISSILGQLHKNTLDMMEWSILSRYLEVDAIFKYGKLAWWQKDFYLLNI